MTYNADYERGYEDGWKAGQRALGAVPAEVFDWLMCDDGCHSPEEHAAHNDGCQPYDEPSPTGESGDSDGGCDGSHPWVAACPKCGLTRGELPEHSDGSSSPKWASYLKDSNVS